MTDPVASTQSPISLTTDGRAPTRPAIGRAVAVAAPSVVAAISLWLSFGAVAPADAHAPRAAVVPGFGWLAAAVVCSVAIAVVASRRVAPRTAAPLYLTALLWLPWLPGPMPDAFLLWQGPLARLVWIATAGAFAAPVLARAFAWVGRRAPRRQRAAAFVLAFVVYGAAAWRMAPVLPGGDEPHYLVIAQSLLYDRDLKIENNHQRRDYQAYLDGEIRPHYLRRGLDREIYSIHAPGLGALVAPAFALGGYPGVVVFLSACSAFGMALLWWTVWRMFASPAAAWIAWGSAALSAPFFFQAFTVFPDAPGAVLVIVCVSALTLRQRTASTRWMAGGALAVAALPWLHTRYAALAGVLGVLLVLRAWRRAPALARATLLLVPAASAGLWFAFFYFIYGTFNPAAPYGGYTQSGLEKIPNGLTGLLLDQQFGILPCAPIYLASIAGLWALWRTSPRLTIEIALVVIPYAALVASYHMWWGGRSSPARFLVPALPILALALAASWEQARSRWSKASILALLTFSAAVPAGLAWIGSGALVYNTRDGYGLWLEALAPLVHLPLALPSLFRAPWPSAWLLAGLWLLVALAGVVLLRAWSSRLSGARGWTAAVAGCLAIVAMAGVTAGWTLARRDGADVAAARWRLLRLAGPASHAVLYEPLPRLARAGAVLPGLEIPSSDRRPSEERLYTAQGVPPGRYTLHVHSHAHLSGGLQVRVGRDPEPMLAVQLAGQEPSAPRFLQLPAGARSLEITGDAEARAAIVRLTLQPRLLIGGGRSLQPLARSVARYGAVQAHFLDEGAFVEPAGFWVRAAGESTVVFCPDPSAPPPTAGLRLLLRNGAVANQVGVVSGAWRVDLDFVAGEERRLDVPLAPGSDVVPVTIRSERGFRPAEHDPSSRDGRALGVWVTAEGQAEPRLPR